MTKFDILFQVVQVGAFFQECQHIIIEVEYDYLGGALPTFRPSADLCNNYNELFDGLMYRINLVRLAQYNFTYINLQ